MKQHRIKKRVNFQRTKSNMPQIANGKGKKQYKKGKKTAVVLAKQKYAGFWQSKLK